MEGDDAAATVLDRPASRATPTSTPAATPEPEPAAEPVTVARGANAATAVGSRSSLGGGASAQTTIASPLDALARDEVLRTRNFIYMGFGVAFGGLAAIPFLPGGYYETRIFVVGILIGMAGMVYLWNRARDAATFHRGPGVTIAWLVAGIAVNTAVPYFGPYSPVPILLLIGVYFVGLGRSGKCAFALYAECSIVQGSAGALAIFGIADPGIVRADYLPVHVQIILQALVQMIFAAAYFISRASRRASLAALGELQDAIRAVSQREALLQEAREELRRALGSGRGRFSDQTIGHYRLGELLGRGAMGEVYEGLDTRDDRPVAVKMLAQTSLGNPDHVTRFMRELQTTVAIDSPYVVRVLDVGQEPLPHLVMEKLVGRDLSSILREKRVLAPAKVVELLQQVGAGITAAGALGVIHRDLKPQNVFLADTTWKILDFGVSRLADTGDTLTQGHLVGTPAYMAPEQARGARVDHRADLYALAAIAYRCLTGHAPFASGEIVDVLYRVVHTPPRRPTSLAKLPDDLDLALAIGLAKQPTDRFATAAELAAAIADALGGRLAEPIRARASRLAAAWTA
ncbi:MAG: serine/threonine-protein kinase [Acidobacteriota bacterium]